jgi:hypothetical protein
MLAPRIELAAPQACSNYVGGDCTGGCPRGLITSMARGQQQVIWSPRPWETEHGTEVSPDISAVVQELGGQRASSYLIHSTFHMHFIFTQSYPVIVQRRLH